MVDYRGVAGEQVTEWKRVRSWLLPAVGTLGVMAVGFTVMGAILIVREGLIVGNVVTELLALACMLVVPHFVVGLVTGSRQGIAAAPPIAAALAPILFTVVAFAAFRGPFLTPFRALNYTIVAIVVWAGTFSGGMWLGATVLGPRLRTWRE